jgi:PhnB protein
MKIPENYNRVMPYLILEDAPGFLTFTQKLFNAKELQKVTDDNGGIIHAEIKIGDSIIMCGNSGGQWKPQPAGLYIHVENSDETYRKAIELGAKSVMEPSDQSYGRASGITDPFGNTWWLTSAKE